MQGELKAFEKLLYDQLIPEFCADRSRRCEPSNFNRASVKVGELDAAYFLKAWDGELIQHVGRGIYRTPRSAVGEQFFWEGQRSKDPRPFSLWLEPIITVANLARLHFDFGWPKHLIGTQSFDWAFDLVAFSPNSESEVIAGEVKKSKVEVDQLLTFMEQFCRDPNLQPPPSGKARNAFKKVTGLRIRKAPVFWAVGPEGLSKVYRVRYCESGVIEFTVTSSEDLRYDTSNWATSHRVDRMSIDDLRERILSHPILASEGNHSSRLWRVVENIQSNAHSDSSDDRLLHLMSRIGVLCRGLSNDLRSGDTSPEDVATLLDQLAELGDISFHQWMRHGR